MTTPHKTLPNPLASGIASMARAAITEIDIAPKPQDTVFGDFDQLVCLSRGVTMAHGTACEATIKMVLDVQDHLRVLPGKIKLPITRTAQRNFESNSVESLSTLNVDADEMQIGSYTPDIICIDKNTDVASILEIKRSTESYAVSMLTSLMDKMIQAALTKQQNSKNGSILSICRQHCCI